MCHDHMPPGHSKKTTASRGGGDWWSKSWAPFWCWKSFCGGGGSIIIPTTTPPVVLYPRYVGFLYWAIALVVFAMPTWNMLVAAPPNNNNNKQRSVVMTRKWFHLVAVMLFRPITFVSPQLLPLSYVLALCGLVVLETLRYDWLLLVGCAVPLWISVCVTVISLRPLSFPCGVSCWNIEFGIGRLKAPLRNDNLGRNGWKVCWNGYFLK